MIEIELLVYKVGDMEFEGRVIRDTEIADPRPGIMLAHAFFGLGAQEIEHAKRLAQLGYVVFACDYYGRGRTPETSDDAFARMTEMNDDRPALAARMATALDTFKTLPFVKADKIAAVGFCFGGKAVLDLARSGADFKAAISLHGVYDAPSDDRNKMKSAVLVLHGWNDPLAPPDAVVALSDELEATCEDWQTVMFGDTSHAFTNPGANAAENGMLFNSRATKRSWMVIDDYLEEKFSD